MKTGLGESEPDLVRCARFAEPQPIRSAPSGTGRHPCPDEVPSRLASQANPVAGRTPAAGTRILGESGHRPKGYFRQRSGAVLSLEERRGRQMKRRLLDGNLSGHLNPTPNARLRAADDLHPRKWIASRLVDSRSADPSPVT